MPRLRYFECNNQAYIYDPATNKLFWACGETRKEITDPKQRGNIMVNSSSMSEDEFNGFVTKNQNQNAM